MKQVSTFIKRLQPTIYLSVFVLACNDEPPNPVQKLSVDLQEQVINPKQLNNARLMATTDYTHLDWTGQIETITRYDDFPSSDSETPSGSITLPAGYVLVGGGAYTFNTSAGGLLVKNYPDVANDTWYASSKSHIDSDPHKIRVFAIGLKIQGISAATLKGLLSYTSVLSSGSEVSHPVADASVGSGYKVIGGGAEVVNPSGWGNMLVQSYPSSTQTWHAESKDHINGDAAKIRAYVIGIPENIPGFGLIDVVVPTASHVSSSGTTVPLNLPLPIDNGSNRYVNTCVGAKDVYSGWGRLLIAMRPQDTAQDPVTPPGFVQSKDHKKASSGDLYGYGLYIRKRP